MGIKFKVVQRVNPKDPLAPRKSYAIIDYNGEVKIREICDDIADGTTVTSSDTFAVLDSFLRKFPRYLRQGRRIKVGELGTFYISLSSTGEENAEDVTANNIKGAKIIFVPGKLLKDALLGLEFQKSRD